MFAIKHENICKDNFEFPFCKFPKVFLTEPQYQKLSDGAKVLYCALSDRNSLSTINEWKDQKGHVFIYYSNKSLCKTLNCSHDTVTKRLRELEKAGLIQRHKPKFGKPDMIYVFPPFTSYELLALQNADKKDYSILVPSTVDCDFSASNKTELIKTEFSETNPSIMGYDEDTIREIIKANIEYEDMLGYDIAQDRLDEMITLMVDICLATNPTIRINGNDYPRQLVIKRFLKLNMQHILYVMDVMNHTTTEIRNIRSYLLTSLFNASATMKNYWEQRVLHDMPELSLENVSEQE